MSDHQNGNPQQPQPPQQSSSSSSSSSSPSPVPLLSSSVSNNNKINSTIDSKLIQSSSTTSDPITFSSTGSSSSSSSSTSSSHSNGTNDGVVGTMENPTVTTTASSSSIQPTGRAVPSWLLMMERNHTLARYHKEEDRQKIRASRMQRMKVLSKLGKSNGVLGNENGGSGSGSETSATTTTTSAPTAVNSLSVSSKICLYHQNHPLKSSMEQLPSSSSSKQQQQQPSISILSSSSPTILSTHQTKSEQSTDQTAETSFAETTLSQSRSDHPSVHSSSSQHSSIALPPPPPPPPPPPSPLKTTTTTIKSDSSTSINSSITSSSSSSSTPTPSSSTPSASSSSTSISDTSLKTDATKVKTATRSMLMMAMRSSKNKKKKNKTKDNDHHKGKHSGGGGSKSTTRSSGMQRELFKQDRIEHNRTLKRLKHNRRDSLNSLNEDEEGEEADGDGGWRLNSSSMRKYHDWLTQPMGVNLLATGFGAKDDPERIVGPPCVICRHADIGYLISPCTCGTSVSIDADGNRVMQHHQKDGMGAKPVHFHCLKQRILARGSLCCIFCGEPYRGVAPIYDCQSPLNALVVAFRFFAFAFIALILAYAFFVAPDYVGYFRSFFHMLGGIFCASIYVGIAMYLYLCCYNRFNRNLVDIYLEPESVCFLA